MTLYERTGDLLVPRFRDGVGLRALSDTAIPMGEGLSGWVAQNYRSILNGNPTVEPNYAAAGNLRSALAIPILARPGDAAAVLTLYSAAEHAFSREHLLLLESLDLSLTRLIRQALEPSPFEEATPPARHTIHLVDLVASA